MYLTPLPFVRSAVFARVEVRPFSPQLGIEAMRHICLVSKEAAIRAMIDLFIFQHRIAQLGQIKVNT